MYQLQIYTINKNYENKNNYLHNIINAQQIKLLL